MSEYMIPIPSRVYNASVGGHVAGADQIIDDKTGLTLDKVAGGALEEKEHTSGSNNGMGRVVLRKNLVEGVNTLTQSMVNKSNTIYVIQYDFTLGEDITIPANCVLRFDGGSISGTNILNGNNTRVVNYSLGDITSLVSNIKLETTVKSIVSIKDIDYLPDGLIITVTNGFYGISDDILKYRVDSAMIKGMNIGGTHVIPIYENNIVTPKHYGAYGKFNNNSNNRTIENYLTVEEANTLFNFAILTSRWVDNVEVHLTIEQGDEIDWIGIQAAIYSEANPIFISTGNYFINKELICPDHTTIIGNNTWKSIINTTQNNINAINFSCDRCQVSNLSIYCPSNYVEGTKGVITDTGSCGILLESRHQCSINRVEIYGFSIGINLGNNSWCNRIDDADIHYCGKGVKLNNETNNITITRCTIAENSLAIEAGGTYTMATLISGCTIEGNICGITLLSAFYGLIEGCYFENNGADSLYDYRGAIYIPSVESNIVGINVLITSCYFYVGTSINQLNQFIILEGNTNNSNIEISNCKFRASTSREYPAYAIRSYGGQKCIFNNNSLFNVEHTIGTNSIGILDNTKIPAVVPGGNTLYRIVKYTLGSSSVFAGDIITISGRITDAVDKISKVEIVVSKEPNYIGTFIGDIPDLKVYAKYDTSESLPTLSIYVISNCGLPIGIISNLLGTVNVESSDEAISSLTEIPLTNFNPTT